MSSGKSFKVKQGDKKEESNNDGGSSLVDRKKTNEAQIEEEKKGNVVPSGASKDSMKASLGVVTEYPDQKPVEVPKL